MTQTPVVVTSSHTRRAFKQHRQICKSVCIVCNSCRSMRMRTAAFLLTVARLHSSKMRAYSIPVQVPMRSTTQTELIGMYCFVIILITSCATNPPRKAAVFGRSAVGERALHGRVSSTKKRKETVTRTLRPQPPQMLLVELYRAEAAPSPPQ